MDRELKQAEITKAKASAEAAGIRMKADALRTSPELVKYKALDVELERARKWNGQLPTTIVGGDTHTLFTLK